MQRNTIIHPSIASWFPDHIQYQAPSTQSKTMFCFYWAYGHPAPSACQSVFILLLCTPSLHRQYETQLMFVFTLDLLSETFSVNFSPSNCISISLCVALEGVSIVKRYPLKQRGPSFFNRNYYPSWKKDAGSSFQTWSFVFDFTTTSVFLPELNGARPPVPFP